MLMALATAFSFMSCSEENNPFFTAGENDYPRILNTDIPEMSGGKPSDLPSVSRNQNFTFTAIVTPTEFTTVTWYIDGKLAHTGTSIDTMLLAGDYDVKIVATTTKGKETFRNCALSVVPLDGDPALANDAKSRWLNPGKEATITGTNIGNVTALYIGDVKVTDFVNNGGSISFRIPELAEGNYKVTIETANGKYGAGNFTISNEKYVAPGVEEVTLWEGSKIINWGDANVQIAKDLMESVPVGTKIKLYYNSVDAEYHAMRITTPSWGDNPEDNLVGQFDITATTPNPFEFEYTAACKDLVDNRNAMLIVGFGYELTKVTYEREAPSETTLWEGDCTIDWGDSNVKVEKDLLADAKVGSKICIYYEMVDAEYHAMRITTPSWGDNPEDNLVGQFDITATTPNPFEFEYTAACKDLVDTRAGMLIVGFGYKLKKVTIK